MEPALIATDLDGTFLSVNAVLLQSNLATARRFVEEDVVLMIATGRSRRWFDALAELRDLGPVAISSNGAAVDRLIRPHPDFLHPIEPERALAFVAALPSELEVSLAVEYEYGWGREPGHPVGHLSGADQVAGPSELLVAGPVIKVLARTCHTDTHAFSPVAVAATEEILQVTFSWYDVRGTVKLSALGVIKSAALVRLLEKIGVDAADTAALGDMHNDLGMLELAGRGYVMADADSCLLGRGFTRIGPNNEGVVGEQILRLLDA